MKGYSTLHSGARLLGVQPVQSPEDLGQGSDASFRILWLNAPWDQSLRQLYILPPRSSIDLVFSQNQTGYLISFPEEMLLMSGCRHYYPFAAVQPALGNDAKPVSIRDGMAIERVIVNLSRECQCARHAADMLIPGLLKVLVISIARLYPQPEPTVSESDDTRLFQRFIRLVSDHRSGRRTVHDYARALSVKPDVLTDCVRKVSGYPASHHIYEHIINVAKHAAISSGASMKEVAYNLGFSDMAHFSKFFRSKAGMTFSNYKRAYQIL